MAALETKIIEYLSTLDCSLSLSQEKSESAAEAIRLALSDACPEDHNIIRRVSTIVRVMPSPASFICVKFGTLTELLRDLDEPYDDYTFSIDQNGNLDTDLDGNTAELFSIAVGYVTREDFWIEPRINGERRTYQSIIEPIITACSIRLRSTVTSAVTSLRGIRFKYNSNMVGHGERSIDTDVKTIISGIRAVVKAVKNAVPSIGNYDVEISGIDIAYWDAFYFCEFLEQTSEYLYALPLILPSKLVGSGVVLARLEIWNRTRNAARETLATTIQRAYRQHLLKRKRHVVSWLISQQIPVTLEGAFPLASKVIRLTV